MDHFLQRNVGLVVRLNKKYYDESRFTKHGIDHAELYYPDGSNPTREVLDRFLEMCETRPAHESIAVHCKAGLGRTGTCIGAYAMKHWGFTSKEVIGWMRICRPGSVIGPQQQYMDSIQDYLHGSAAAVSSKHFRCLPSPRGVTVTPHQLVDDGDRSQGDFLISAKAQSPHSPGKKQIVLNDFDGSDAAAAAANNSSPNGGALYSLRMSLSRKVFGK